MKKLLTTALLLVAAVTAQAETREAQINELISGVINDDQCIEGITYSIPNPPDTYQLAIRASMVGGIGQTGPLISFAYNGGQRLYPGRENIVVLSGSHLNISVGSTACGSGTNVPYEILVTKVPETVPLHGVIKFYEKSTDAVTGAEKLVRPTINSANFQTAVGDAAVNIYSESGEFVKAAWIDLQRTKPGAETFDLVYAANLPAGRYIVATSKGGVTTWGTGAPRVKASAIEVVGDTKKDFTIYPALPHIDSLSNDIIAVGQSAPLTINGTGFGTSKGYIDFGGYVTNSNIAMWSDTAITITVPKSAISGCLRVFAKYAAGSNCVDTQVTR